MNLNVISQLFLLVSNQLKEKISKLLLICKSYYILTKVEKNQVFLKYSYETFKRLKINWLLHVVWRGLWWREFPRQWSQVKTIASSLTQKIIHYHLNHRHSCVTDSCPDNANIIWANTIKRKLSIWETYIKAAHPIYAIENNESFWRI